MADTFEAFIEKERGRLQEAREEAQLAINAAQEKLREIDRELEAINAYEAVKTGKASKAAARTTGGTRRSGMRKQVLELVSSSTSGLTAAAAIEALQATEASAQTAVRNALSALKRGGKVVLDGKLYKSA